MVSKQNQKLEKVMDSLKSHAVGNLEMVFSYENEDSNSYIEIWDTDKEKILESYTHESIDIDILKIDFPEFFNQEYTMLQADLLRYLKENVEFSCEPIEHNQGWEITYRDEDGCYLSTYNKNQSLTFKTKLA